MANGELTDEQEKEIGIVQQVIEVAAKNLIAIMVLAPTAYMITQGTNVPEGWYTVVGAVVMYYFKK